MDIQLPDISGIEAIRRLKADEQTRAIPIIVVSALRCHAKRPVFLQVAAKPISQNHSVVRSWLS
jgi:CheY-like chemotaxis protein